MSGELPTTGEDADPGLTLEPNGESEPEPCAHCGHYSRSVNGFIHRGENGPTCAAYLVHWTLGVSEHLANFDLILGPWGDGADPALRLAISLTYRNDAEQRGFTLIDAKGRPHDKREMVGRALARDEVIGSPTLAAEVFRLVDFILLHDSRIGSIETKPHGIRSGVGKIFRFFGKRAGP
ncbi:hypothetical protein OKA05_14525 [Luteolibacter arcticus]|uniref:Uncharacterized protein n=1 Tax=Luteolibacter arcticus TaxID=1581411 RepID=A0ABT3GJS9_9BACT|nr:hypothetical protein [Luteolibacter arcticus]MCW1923779.1 hypothetical protein [Luteolibacter arcticus]